MYNKTIFRNIKIGNFISNITQIENHFSATTECGIIIQKI